MNIWPFTARYKLECRVAELEYHLAKAEIKDHTIARLRTLLEEERSYSKRLALDLLKANAEIRKLEDGGTR